MNKVEGQRPERVLVLSGGGGRGAYQVGACEVLYERGWRPDVILGNSIGATNGAILAAPRSEGAAELGGIELLKQVWRQEIAGNKLHQVSDAWPAFLGKLIQWGISLAQQIEAPGARSLADDALLDELVDRLAEEAEVQERSFEQGAEGAIKGALKRVLGRVGRALVALLSKPALMDRPNWAALLEEHVDLQRLNDASSGCPTLGVTAIKAATGELGYAWNRLPAGVDGAPTALTVDHLMASSSIPGIYPATEIGWVQWWDGALSANTPVGPAIDVLLHGLPARTEIVVVLMTPYEEATIAGSAPPTVLDALRRFLDWMMMASLHRELGRLEAAQREWVRIVAPRELMGVVQIIDYGVEDVEALMEMGREDARRALV